MTAHLAGSTPPATVGVHLVTLGCARNDVDSEELAARLEQGGFHLVAEPGQAEAVVVNTCGFVEAAKKDSVDTLFAAAELKATHGVRAVVAVGCLAERYGDQLAASLPEADAVLSFDDYGDIAARLQGILSGGEHVPHIPRDRRALLPVTPVARQVAARGVSTPGHAGAGWLDELPAGVAPASGPPIARRRLSDSPTAPVKIASGCDRRCTFCAIPAFRGAYLSRPPADIVAEARWLVERGVQEVFLVSENTSSYGKDLGDIRALEKLLSRLSVVDGLQWIRVSYLQPAEMRPSLVEAMTATDKVVPYFDLSFQHASPGVLRRMRRFGGPDAFLSLLTSIRQAAPDAGIRSNVICGFPGETDRDVQVLCEFLAAARLDAIGVFGYSDEEGTQASGLDGQLDGGEIEARRAHVSDLVEELMTQRAEDRVGERVRVLVEERSGLGRGAHQGPEVDGSTQLIGARRYLVGEMLPAVVVDSVGADLVAEVVRG
jgi:ribosomal protein S12 methylthiotransferase